MLILLLLWQRTYRGGFYLFPFQPLDLDVYLDLYVHDLFYKLRIFKQTRKLKNYAY